MKLRQKLAAVLAASMVLTAVPVVTFADSTNRVSNIVSAVDGTVITHEDPVYLIMDFDATTRNDTTFYMESEDFDFQVSEYINYALNESGALSVIKTNFENEILAIANAATATSVTVTGIEFNINGEVTDIKNDAKVTLAQIKAKGSSTLTSLETATKALMRGKLNYRISSNGTVRIEGLDVSDFVEIEVPVNEHEKIKEARATLEKAKKALSDEQADLKLVEAQIKSAKDEITALEKKIAEGQADKTEVDKLEGKVAKLKVDIEAIEGTTGTLKGLEQAVVDAKIALSQVTTTGQDLEDAQDAVELAEANLAATKADLADLKAELVKAEKALAEAEAVVDIAALQKRLDALNDAVPTLNAEKANLETKIGAEADPASSADGASLWAKVNDAEDKLEAAIAVYGSASNQQNYSSALNISLEYISSNQIRVNVVNNANNTLNDRRIKLPVMGKVKKGEPAISIFNQDTATTAGKYFITRESIEDGKRLVATADDAKAITVDGGTIADITIAEREHNTLKAGQYESREIVLELPKNSDLIFSRESKQDIELEGIRAFAPYVVFTNKDTMDKAIRDNDVRSMYAKLMDLSSDSDKVNGFVKIEDKGKTMTVTLPALEGATTTLGEWVIKNVAVEPESARDEAREGAVEITVKDTKDEKFLKDTKLTVGNVGEYGVSVVCEKPVDLVAGKGSKEVKVVVQEGVIESIDDKRWATFTLSEGAYIKIDDENQGKEIQETVDRGLKDIVTIKENGDKISDYSITRVDTNSDGNIVGFKVEFAYDSDGGFLDVKKANKVEFAFDVQAATATTGDVMLSIDGRAFEHDAVKIATVTAPIEVTYDATEVKVGLQKQVGQTITIKETDKDMLEKGFLYVELEDGEFFSKKSDIKVNVPKESSLQVEVKDVDKNILTLEVTRQSREATTFTIEGIEYTIDRTIPEGKIDAYVFGSALRSYDGVWGYRTARTRTPEYVAAKDANYDRTILELFTTEDKIKAEGLIEVPTKNTEDITDTSKAVEAKFVIGSSQYVVNGESKTMDAAAYVADGRTMVPVRYLCEALGLPDEALGYSNATGKTVVTIISGGKVVSLTNGSNVLSVNGEKLTMETAVVIKDGRSYAPVSEIARVLGVATNWDAASQTATFTSGK